MELILGIIIGFLTGLAADVFRRQRSLAVAPPPSPEESRLGILDVSGERLRELKREPLFPVYVLLGRISNSLRFAHTAPLEVYDEGTPRAARQLNGAFFLQVALAQEALDTLRKLGPKLKDRDVWRKEIVPIFRDSDVEQLERQMVRDLRRKLVFHFDLEAIETGIDRVRDTGARLMASRGSEVKDVHFPYSDEVALGFLVPTVGMSDEQYRDAIMPRMRKATDLSIRLAVAVERVILDLSRDWRLKGVWLEPENPDT